LWADYFDQQGIQYAFFSAANAAALQQARRDALLASEEGMDKADNSEEEDNGEEEEESGEDEEESDYEESEDSYYSAEEEESPEGQDPRARVLTVLELENLFERVAPDLSSTSLRFSTLCTN
jgi:large subunit GTPase 1